MSKTALFVFAHMDDETILTYGTIKKLKDCGYNIIIATFCGNGRKGNSEQKLRIASYNKIINNLEIDDKKIYFEYDLSLTQEFVNSRFSNLINKYSPELVITHSIHDLHSEHRMLAEASLIACRTFPESPVKQLLHTVSPTYRFTYNNFGTFTPNYFVDCSKYKIDKYTALLKYSTEFSNQMRMDIRSPESVIKCGEVEGRKIGKDFCESYEQIFSIV